jgi:hypothetical protein
MNKNIKIKISEIDTVKNPQAVKFSLTYHARKMDNSQVSYEIMSKLKGQEDIILEVNSSLLNLSEKENKELFSKLEDTFEKMDIKYNNKKIKVTAKRAILSISVSNKEINGFQLFARITDITWNDEAFKRIIPQIGIRYYILESGNQIDPDSFAVLDDEEKDKLCSMVIFDNIFFGCMGINTPYKKDEILDILNK